MPARLRRSLALLTLAAAAACQAVPLEPAKKGAAPPAARGAGPHPATSGKPGTAPGTAPTSATAGAAALLAAPRGGQSLVLTGSAAIDASYLVTARTGAALQVNGRSILAAGPGLRLEDAAAVVSKTRLVGPDGVEIVSKTRLVGPDGVEIVSKTRLVTAEGDLIAVADGNIISDNGGGLLSDHGGAVVANNGGSLVSNNGGGLVSNNGGGLVSKAKYALRGADPAPTIGEIRPAAGLRIVVRSLRTGLPVAVGVDPAGAPVYAVYTNLSGGYRLYLPAEEADNVLVTAEVPRTADERQRFALLAAVGAEQEATLDEDTALVTRAVREVFAGRLAATFTEDPARVACILASSQSLDPALKELLLTMVTDLHAAAVAAGVSATPDQAGAVRVLAQRCADALLAPLDLTAIEVPDKGNASDAPPNTVGRPALTVLTEVLREGRQGAIERMSADPRFFETQPYLATANACDPGRYAIRKPADVNDFVIAEYLVNNSDPGLFLASAVFNSLGLPTRFDFSIPAIRLTRAMDAILNNLVVVYIGNANGEQDAVRAIIRAYDPTRAGSSGNAPPATFRSPCPRPGASPAFPGCGP